MRAQHTPMLYVLLPLLLGLVAANLNSSYPIIVTALCALCLLSMVVWQRAKVLIYPTICCIGYIIAVLSSPEGTIEQQSATIILEVKDSGNATITSIASENNGWMPANHKVMLWGVDSLSYTTLCVRAEIIPLDPSKNSYYKAMSRKGFKASIKINEIISRTDNNQKPLPIRLNQWAIERLERVKLRGEAFALASAVGLAQRDGLDKQIITSYNRSGTSHLLALSGLHLGVVVLIISALTYFLPLLRNGHIVADVVAIIAIWLFATMVGLSESVMRAAWMFSLLKLSSIISRQYNSLNALLTAAVIILCLDPSALYDLGFTLSFAAVAAIILVGVPLLRIVTTHNYILDFVISSIVISTVATIATAPLISNAFGYIVLLSPLTTLPLLLTIFVIIFATTLWVVAPIPLLKPLIYWVLEISTTIQNYLVEWFASWGVGVIEYRLTQAEFGLSYCGIALLFALILHLIRRGEKRAEERKIEIEFREELE